jgi:hypothetical protein
MNPSLRADCVAYIVIKSSVLNIEGVPELS